MPANRHALIRYKAIDDCLSRRQKNWTLDMLIEKVSEVLNDYEGTGKEISRRTIQQDIYNMRSEKLGYNAPIKVKANKYYYYDDPDYSIANIPLGRQDLDRMKAAVEILSQFKAFSHFRTLGETVQKLEDHVHAAETGQIPAIDFEKNDDLKGLEHLDMAYQAVAGQKALSVVYQSFRASKPQTLTFHPWWLKEYSNRWFVVGLVNRKDDIVTLALDRIIKIQISPATPYQPSPGLHPGEYYKNVLGVTVPKNVPPEEILLRADTNNAPYLETKPLHWSQQVVSRKDGELVVSLKVCLNFELEKTLLAMGEGVEVLAPDSLRTRIKKRLFEAASQYFKQA